MSDRKTSLALIDRESYEPAYVQLVRILRGQIASGVFRPGDRIPSEAQLCKQYQVSPMTVRRAVNTLLEQDVVITTQGKGTFVKPLELGAGIFGLQGLTALFQDKTTTTVRMLQARIVKANERVARKLDLTEGQRAVYLRRLLLKNSEPILYHQEYLPYDPTRPIVEAEMEATSLHGLFAGTGESDFKGGVLTIEATTLQEEEAKLLEGEMNQAAFRIAHTFYDFRDIPSSWGWFICKGDRLSFRTTVGIWGET